MNLQLQQGIYAVGSQIEKILRSHWHHNFIKPHNSVSSTNMDKTLASLAGWPEILDELGISVHFKLPSMPQEANGFLMLWDAVLAIPGT